MQITIRIEPPYEQAARQRAKDDYYQRTLEEIVAVFVRQYASYAVVGDDPDLARSAV